MTIEIEPVNGEAGVYGMPNGFWPAFCVETPVAEVLGCEYKNNFLTIKYEHDGYDGAWISEADALKMYELLLEYVKTEEYEYHRYFGSRKRQMEYMLDFLPVCGGFRMKH